MSKWFKTGEHWIWLNAGALAISVVMVVGLTLLIAIRGLAHFWPAEVVQMQYDNNGKMETILAEIVEHETKYVGDPDKDGHLETSTLLKIGNRESFGLDFRWIKEQNIIEQSIPQHAVVLERHEWGNFYGMYESAQRHSETISGLESWDTVQQWIADAIEMHHEIKSIEKVDIGIVNGAMEKLRLKERGYILDNALTDERKAELKAERAELDAEYEAIMKDLNQRHADLKAAGEINFKISTGETRTIHIKEIVHAFMPNDMSLGGKLGHYAMKAWEFVSDDPREANTEGGIFPAIFGTVMMVFLMTILVTPFGVIAAVYLREYAKQGPVVRMIRISVNNLAGVPSIVFGVFGLGFFVYFLGGSIDELFFPEALPSPTFGSPGLLWASLTLALLTLPVVIVSTEEGLARIPSAVREGSLALGATKIETLWRTVLPMASPAIMTGLILAIARAAGEVAPLMLVGVVKLAPDLVVDMTAPFIHLDRQFMHLGFHIYDVGFQSPNVEAARPLVYATALLLVLVIIGLNLAAIFIRNRLREKYRSLEH